MTTRRVDWQLVAEAVAEARANYHLLEDEFQHGNAEQWVIVYELGMHGPRFSVHPMYVDEEGRTMQDLHTTLAQGFVPYRLAFGG